MAKQKDEKTNVMRLLDQKKTPYAAHACPVGAAAPDGAAVAQMLGQNPDAVFKTDRIHTSKDTVLDEANIALLRDVALRYIAGWIDSRPTTNGKEVQAWTI